MKLQNTIKIWLIPVIVLLVGTSCEKELDKVPLDQFSTESFWANENDAKLALSAVYRGNINFGLNPPNAAVTDWWTLVGLMWMDFATDNAYDKRGENSPFHVLTNGTLTSTSVTVAQYWNVSYAKIARCNDFLANIDRVSMDENKKKRMIAEVRFLRACQYFYMSQFWGSVPLVTKLLTLEEANSVTKAPKAEIVNFVITELTEAAAILPRHKDIPAAEKGRASKQAALAFLGRMYLGEGRFADAANTYKTIIDFNDNIIDPDYAGIFLIAKENSNEHIFSVQYIENLAPFFSQQQLFPAVAGGFHHVSPLGSLVEEYDFTNGTEFSYNSPLYDPADLYKNRDPRLKYSILVNGSDFGNLKYISHPDAKTGDPVGSAIQTTATGYGLRKFVDEKFIGNNLSNYGGNMPVIRYAEVLLSYLEAKLEAGQAIDQALLDATINKVRGRASVNMPPITETDPILLRPILREERRIETAFEGLRYWDLLRWRIADQVLKADFYGAPFPNAVKPLRKKGTTTDPYKRWFVTTRNFRMQDYTWPIPQAEININPNLK